MRCKVHVRFGKKRAPLRARSLHGMALNTMKKGKGKLVNIWIHLA